MPTGFGYMLCMQADSRQIPLRDESVHMVCTSPPYYNLRDYGTGAWEGGDPTCLHSPAATPQRRGMASSTLGGGKQTTGHQQEGYGQQCGRCRAQRVDQQIGNESVHDCLGWATGENCGHCYLCHVRQVFSEVWRVLREDGTLWLNIGDSYNAGGRIGHGTRIGYKQGTNRASATGADACRPSAPGLKPKDLCGIPQRLALALQSDGWYWRSTIIWEKPNAMPNSQQDRPTTSHEYVLLLTKKAHYFYDAVAIAEPHTRDWTGSCGPANYKADKLAWEGLTGLHRNGTSHQGIMSAVPNPVGRTARDVWRIATEPGEGSHYAKMPTTLAEKCLRAGTSEYGVCSLCGSPWQRLIERQRLLDGHMPVSGSFCKPEDHFRMPANGKGHSRYSTQTTEHGWAPTCSCVNNTPVPAVVLDPFTGSSTTLVVARSLGRSAVGVDLSWEYLHDVSRTRLGLTALQAWHNGCTPTHECFDDLPLFAMGDA